jgi:3',5'-cyclic AMP phosphodiesterase CpdA
LITTLNIEPSGDRSRWALLADPHSPADPGDGRPPHKPAANFPAGAREVIKAAPQAAMILGDIAYRFGLPEDYAAAKPVITEMAEHFPVCLTIGNHDVRENFLSAFAPTTTADPAPPKSIVVVNHPPVRFIILDSLYRVDVVPGLLGFRQREWLSRFLDNTEPIPTVICFHHALDDNDASLFDADRLLGILLPRRQVKAMMHGHWHKLRAYDIEDLHVLQLPSIGMPLEDGVPIGWLSAGFTSSGADFQMYSIADPAGPIPVPGAFSLKWR